MSESASEVHSLPQPAPRDYRGLARAAVLLLAALVVLVGVAVLRQNRGGGAQTVELATPYQAIMLSNGQAYFGKLEQAGSAYPVLREVYYVQTQVQAEGKQMTNTLIKRGKEWHAPDHMVLNAQHILFIEPVTANSTLAKLIAELKKKE